MAKKRILLLIPHLGGGGAEQVALLLAKGLSAEKYDLHLGLVTESKVTQSEANQSGTPNLNASAEVPSWVTVHDLGCRRVRSAAAPLLRLVWRVRPDLILSGMAHLNFLVLLLRPWFPRQTRVAARQNATVSSALAADRHPRLRRSLYRLLYAFSDRIICQSRAMANDLAAELDLEPRQIAILPNPLDLAGIRAAAAGASLWCGPGPHLLAAGRLAPEKGFDLLLESFAALRAHFPQADVIIAGEGAGRAALEVQIRRLGLESCVRLAGHAGPPYRFFPGATLFVLSSRHEGMPNALLEAAAAGLPLVATPASGGVSDLLTGCAGAWLASSISAPALSESLLLALGELKPAQRIQFPFFSHPA